MQGALITDFIMICAGALHRANGGYQLPVAQGADVGSLRRDATLRPGNQTGMTTNIIQKPDAALTTLLDALPGSDSVALLLQRDHELLHTPILRQCLDSLGCPLLVVR